MSDLGQPQPPSQLLPPAPAPLPTPVQSTTQTGNAVLVQPPVTQVATALATSVAADTRAPKIEVLKDGNWLAWMTRMTAVLKQKRLLDVITGNIAELQDPVVAIKWQN